MIDMTLKQLTDRAVTEHGTIVWDDAAIEFLGGIELDDEVWVEDDGDISIEDVDATMAREDGNVHTMCIGRCE